MVPKNPMDQTEFPITSSPGSIPFFAKQKISLPENPVLIAISRRTIQKSLPDCREDFDTMISRLLPSL